VSSAGRKFEIRTKVLGVYDKGKASVVETEWNLVDSHNEEVYTRAIGSSFYVGQGGWGGPKGVSLAFLPLSSLLLLDLLLLVVSVVVMAEIHELLDLRNFQ